MGRVMSELSVPEHASDVGLLRTVLWADRASSRCVEPTDTTCAGAHAQQSAYAESAYINMQWLLTDARMHTAGRWLQSFASRFVRPGAVATFYRQAAAAAEKSREKGKASKVKGRNQRATKYAGAKGSVRNSRRSSVKTTGAKAREHAAAISCATPSGGVV